MRKNRTAGLMLAATTAIVLSNGLAAHAAGDLITDLGNTVTGTTEELVPSILPSASIEPEHELDGTVVLPLVDPPASDAGEPELRNGDEPAPAEDGSSPASSDSGNAPAVGAAPGVSPVTTPAKVTGGGTLPETTKKIASNATLTAAAGTLAANIGRLAKPLGIPVGLAAAVAVMLLIATRRPVALRKVEEEGTWGYEGRGHRL